ncbi:type II toxin-antitoxin system PemK/MazF family toxin [Modestobacter sp. Leaf380]|uniref:type II toxin-antitoxin system PemK/MazF family toxin n=1 Tax=Modestobacter sp. Leaf380 TaxID=1736356 RepID=UPI0009EA3E09|nr:type II toxin-antitoxin system PemK/MazF family toxin [Modestobacter sp. Leaf380]
MASGWKSVLDRVVRTLVREGGAELRRRSSARPGRAPGPSADRPRATLRDRPSDADLARPAARGAGDFTGRGEIAYAPRDDGRPDPGEVVWAWVPYEEGDGRGKDRPVLVVGRTGSDLLGLMLTSKDHDRDAADEARHGRHWLDVGTGGWDRQGRPSEVRLDRVLRIDPDDVRREGATLDRRRFDTVATEARRVLGW